MEKIAHLWNVNQFITKLNAPQSTNLQTFYIQSCKKLSQGTRLPPQNFGPATMCSYCGSLWKTVDHKIRISRGKQVSKSVKKIVRSMNAADKKVPKVRVTLGEKCMKNQANKLVIKCSVCSNNTIIPLTKPKREKVQKTKNTEAEGAQNSCKRKKKRTKDKTAGLNIAGTPKLKVENVSEGSKETSTKKMRSTTNFITPTQKLKKLNIGRLKDIVNQGTTPPKRKSLHKFLTELC